MSKANSGALARAATAIVVAVVAALPTPPAGATELPVLNISVDRQIAVEGTLQPVLIELHLDRPAPAGGVCIELDLAGGTARPGEDFRLAGAIPAIPEGGMVASVPVEIIDDNVNEPDETVLVLLRPSDCYQPGESHEFHLLIRDDDDSAGSLGERLQEIIARVPDPLIASQLATLAQLCATDRPEPGSPLEVRCQQLRLALRDPTAAQQLVNSLRGVISEESSTQRRGFRMLAGTQLGAIGRRLEAVRGGGGAGIALVDSGLRAGNTFLPLAANVADDGELLGRGIGVFASAVIGNGSRDATTMENGYDSDSDTFLVGVDKRFDPFWVVGLAYSRTRFEADLSGDSGDLALDIDGLTLYASRSFERGWLDASLGKSVGELRQTRIARFSGSTDEGDFSSLDVLRGSPDIDLLTATLSGGWDWQRGSASFGPRFSIEHSRFEVDGYAETAVVGSDAFALRLDAQRVRSTLVRVGAGLQWAVSLPQGVLLPQFDAYGVAQLQDDAGSLSGSFLHDPQARPFLLPTEGVDARFGEASASLAMQFAGGRSGYLSYRRLFGFNATEQSYWSLGLRWEF